MKIKAFTLVELMVVMAIIAFLTVAAYGGLTFALRQGRDTQRMRIADQIQTALTAYYADWQTYPGCTYSGNGTNTRFSGGVQGVGVPGYFTCPNAFDSDASATSSLINAQVPGGLKNYFEGEFTSGPMAKTNSHLNDIRYYYVKNSDGSGSRFTVCVGLENPRGGNIKTGIRSTSSSHPGCYCNGSDQSAIACVLLSD